MRNIFVVATSLALAGCSSYSMGDMFKSTPPTATVQFESQPAGAEARTSTGQTCKTPCSLSVSAENTFTTTFTLPKYQPETVQVQIVKQAPDANGVTAVTDPNPVVAELQPVTPPKKGRSAPKASAAPKAKKPKAAAAPAAEESPFPTPTR